MQEPNVRIVDATPVASSLIEGHRDFGYSVHTALADIIDNSISAGATEVHLLADTASEKPMVAISDNGLGMSEAELIQAMRLGSKNPTSERAASDLGRFGLGLKSASFSQCRRLTVLTSQHGLTSCARWDIDNVSSRDAWSLELIDEHNTVDGSELLSKTGTVVVWQKLDRLGGGYERDHEKRVAQINTELSGAEHYLRLVFHRYLEGSKPQLKLYLNGRLLSPIDPLASSFESGQWDPPDEIKLEAGTVHIRCRTLPHHRMISREAWEEIGGPEGHLKSQGLYVYRENRLIISGGWLGLARQTELTKLCRIAIDIPNTMDSEWKIDVKKASAQLPPIVRERLKKVVERFLGTSKRTYRKRGQRLVDEDRFPIWSRFHENGQVVFRPNLEHPVFQAYVEQLPEEQKAGFERCVRIIGSGLPIETLHAELTGNAEAVVSDETSAPDLKELVYSIGDKLTENGMSANETMDTMRSYAFFRLQWDSVEPILKKFIAESEL